VSGTLVATDTVLFDWLASEDWLSGVVSYTLWVSGTEYTALSDQLQATIPGEGAYDWTVQAYDLAGNVSGYTDTWRLLADLDPPTAPVPITPTAGVVLTYTTPITLLWQASDDAVAGVDFYTAVVTDSMGVRTGVYTVAAPLTHTPAFTLSDDGDYWWGVWAVDRVGRVSSQGGPASFEVDAAPPTLPRLISPADGVLTRTAAISLTWAQSLQAVTYTVHLNAGQYPVLDAAASPVISPTLLNDGVYTWTVAALDRFQRTSGVTSTWVFTVDATPPSVPNPVYPGEGTTLLTNTVPFTWQASIDPVSGVAGYGLVVTGPTMIHQVGTGNVTGTSLSMLSEGTYTWTLRARDEAGNWSAYAEPIVFEVDAYPPSLPVLLSPPDETFTDDPEVTFDWSFVPEAVTYTVRINGAAYTVLNPSSAITFTLAESAYEWSVAAWDAYSRTLGYVSPSWEVTVDHTPPAVPTVITPTMGRSGPGPVLFQWSAVVTDALGNPELSAPVSYTLVISGQLPIVFTETTRSVILSDGVYTWTVRTTDRAGNMGDMVDGGVFTVETPIRKVYLPVSLKNYSQPPAPTGRPDLVVDSITLIHRGGREYSVQVTVRNQSVTSVAYGNNFYVAVYVDPAQAPTYETIPSLTPQVQWGVQGSWFGAGESRVLESVYTFGGAGEHTIYGWADPYQTVLELNENNNSRVITQDVAGGGVGVTVGNGGELSPGPYPTPTISP
jgi:hypothetical protein